MNQNQKCEQIELILSMIITQFKVNIIKYIYFLMTKPYTSFRDSNIKTKLIVCITLSFIRKHWIDNRLFIFLKF